MRKQKYHTGYFYLILFITGMVLWPHDVCRAYDEWRGNVDANINLRQSPGLDGKIITGLSRGERVIVKNQKNNWYQVVLEGEAFGYKGWVYEKYVSKVPAEGKIPESLGKHEITEHVLEENSQKNQVSENIKKQAFQVKSNDNPVESIKAVDAGSVTPMNRKIAETSDFPWAGITSGNINLRKYPGINGKVLTGIPQGEKVIVLEQKEGWFRIEPSDNRYGYNGWAYGRYILRALKKEDELSLNQEVMQPQNLHGETLTENIVSKEEKNTEEPIAKAIKELMPLPVVESGAPETGVIEEKKQEALYLNDSAVENEPNSTAGAEKILKMQAQEGPQAESIAPLDIEIKKERQIVNPVGKPRADFSGTGDFFKLLLRLSSVVLSCLALVLSYKAFHMAQTSREMAGKLEYIKKDIDKYLQRLKEKRNFQRKTSLTVVDFVVQGRAYSGYIHNISPGGAFIETREPFSVGPELTMTFPSPDNQGYQKKNGEIVRTDVKGIGVRFFAASEGMDKV